MMRWFSDLATLAFCDTVQLRKRIIERQQLNGFSLRQGVEPSSAEFIAALAAGNNSQKILQIGCGLSTIALAAAARATGGYLVSVHTDGEKQDIVRNHMQYLGLMDSTEFIACDPIQLISRTRDIDFTYFTGDPSNYIRLFDLLTLQDGALVLADNALSEASNEYIQHVRRQPGLDSSTLPLARGVEVTKVLCLERFNLGRLLYSGSGRAAETVNLMESDCIQTEDSVKEDRVLSSEKHSADVDCDNAYTGEEVQVTQSDTRNSGQGLGIQKVQEMTPSLQVQSEAPEAGDAIVKGEISDSLDELNSPLLIDGCTTSSGTSGTIFIGNTKPVVLRDTVNRRDACSVFKVNFRNCNGETEVSITGLNWDMLLTDITMAFNDMGVSVKAAKISTYDNIIEDVFYVVDAESKAPLHASRWNAIRKRILQRIKSVQTGGG